MIDSLWMGMEVWAKKQPCANSTFSSALRSMPTIIGPYKVVIQVQGTRFCMWLRSYRQQQRAIQNKEEHMLFGMDFTPLVEQCTKTWGGPFTWVLKLSGVTRRVVHFRHGDTWYNSLLFLGHGVKDVQKIFSLRSPFLRVHGLTPYCHSVQKYTMNEMHH